MLLFLIYRIGGSIMKGLFTSFRKFKSAFELKVGCGFLKIREILKSAF